jgi:hypothetical protein
MLLSARCSLFRAKGFFCNLDVLYGSLGIGKLKFLIPKKNFIFISSCKFFLILVIKTPDPDWIRIGIQPKMLDPNQMNTDPQPWKKVSYLVLREDALFHQDPHWSPQF